MPLYEYECDSCGHRFEVIQKFSDALVKVCPKCGAAVQKLISAPAFQLKGSGWYVTDYAKKDGGAAGKQDAESKADTASAKDAKADQAGKADKAEKSDKPDTPHKADKPEKQEKSEKSAKSEKADKPASSTSATDSGSSSSAPPPSKLKP